jgi:creatinine amidohydrolase
MDLATSTWTEADEAGTDLAVLPVGSTEQHGPHAPLGTDTLAAEAVASAGVERADASAVVGPAIPVGVAAEHRQFAGTLWVSEDTFRAYVRETIESLLAHGWDRVVVVNGHGGNVAPLREVCGRVTRERDAHAVSFTWFDAIDPDEFAFEGGMGHGGPVETSLVRHLDAALVDADRFGAAAEGAAEQWGEWQSGVNLAYDTAEFAESGVVGDPSESSAELGAQLLAVASERLADLLAVVQSRE